MQPIKKIVVGLKYSPIDASLVAYVSRLVELLQAERIDFLHIVKLSLPDEIKKNFPELEETALKERKAEITKVVQENFKPEKEIQLNIDVHSASNKLKGVVEYIRTNEMDLAIVGRSTVTGKSSNLIQRLARRAPCQLLILPEEVTMRIDKNDILHKFLVPVDFSEYSKLALQRAIILAARNKDTHPVEIVCQHVFTVPSGYHYTGKTKTEFAKIMKKNAQESFDNWISTFDTKGVKITSVMSEDTDEDKTSDIKKLAKKIDADCIIIGSKGKTATVAFFMGSLAEKLVKNAANFTLLMVRKKDDYEGVFDQIMKI